MALERVIVELFCGTQSDADAVVAAIQQKLATKPMRTVNVALTVTQMGPTGPWRVRGDVAFPDRTQAIEIRDDVVAKWNAGPLQSKILANSTVTVHQCAHNEGEEAPYQSCRERQLEVRAKA